MVDSDIIYAKVDIIQRCLNRIRTVTGLNPKSLEDVDTQDVFILNLQRAAQAAIDLAIHIVASEGLGLPRDLKESFELAFRAGILPMDLTGRLKKMVGFRNIAVHEYQNLDVAVLQSILTGNLKDLEEFYSVVLKHYNLAK